jgi:hypothetical protein
MSSLMAGGGQRFTVGDAVITRGEEVNRPG